MKENLDFFLKIMNQNDIRDIVDLLTDAIDTRDWETVENTKAILIEFLDEYEEDETEE
jgi:hypothetical protein